MPYPTSKSNPTSRASSTRASNPTLVPAGEFKRGKSKTPTPKLASGDNPPVRDARSGQESLSPRRGSEQSGSDGNPSKASLSVPPKPGRVDRQRYSPIFDGRLESVLSQPHETSSTPTTGPTATVPQSSSSSTSERFEQARSSPEESGQSSSETRKDGGTTKSSPRSVLGNDPNVQNPPRDLSTSGRSLQNQPRKELSPFTLRDAKKVFSLLFNQIEHIVDGNGVIILDTLRSFITDQLSTFSVSCRRDITTPLSNSIQQTVDKTDNHFKSVKFSITNIANTCNSLSLQSQSSHSLLSELLQTVRSMQTMNTDKDTGISCDCEFNKLTIKEDIVECCTLLTSEVTTRLESYKKELSAIVDVKDKKLVQVVQELSARIESLSKEIKAIALDGMEKTGECVHSTRNDNPRIQNGNRETTTLPDRDPSHNDVMLFGISHEIKQLAKAVRSKNESCVTKSSVEQMIRDLSEEHRRDFSSLSTKLDQLLSQFRDDGAEVRASIGEINDRMDTSPVRSSGQAAQPGSNFRRRNNHYSIQPTNSDNFRNPQPINIQSVGISEMQKQLWAAVNKLDWPKFSGQGEYDHTEFIDWIDDCRDETSIPDEYIQVKLLSILTGVASQWYKTMRKDHKDEKWDFWREEIRKQYGTSNWMRKKQESFEKDRFIPGETPVSSWVTRQYRRLRAFEPQLSQQSINFRLLGLMDREVEYATKNAMQSTTADMSTLINVLEDIVDKTRLGRKRFSPKSIEKTPSKVIEGREKAPVTGDIKCYSCQKTGHTSRNCPSKVNNDLIVKWQFSLPQGAIIW
ncbi:hypothetical protein PGTUg99_030955 [Puccinia graminis f. sp. tritici]|uniref:CCHC-type domain-containing protein n=1 Tax=Puccinia graminis f. sp. tritici TaxID=56615 RepID=A0A5B0RG39_PUCGR|nr:hypothetical protein PGTUg99_030955 [Puccinia graminis f. sp. tritici]